VSGSGPSLLVAGGRMPAPVGDCSTTPRGYIFHGASAGSGGFLPGRLLVSHCFHSGVSYGHFAISMHQAGGPHPYQGRVHPDLSGEAEQLSTAIRGAT
jgi:hypothetical protein